MTTATTKRQAAKATCEKCLQCDAALAARKLMTSCDVCGGTGWTLAEKKVRKQRGATKAQLAHRKKLFAPASPSIHDDISSLKGE